MSTGTINAPAPERQLPPQQDPWGEAVADAPHDENGHIQLDDRQVAERYREIMNHYHDPEVKQPPVPASPEHVPTRTSEEIARRNNEAMLANFVLARTLGDSNPELLNELTEATQNVDTIPLPAIRPDNYQGRHTRPTRPRGYKGRHRQ